MVQFGLSDLSSIFKFFQLLETMSDDIKRSMEHNHNDVVTNDYCISLVFYAGHRHYSMPKWFGLGKWYISYTMNRAGLYGLYACSDGHVVRPAPWCSITASGGVGVLYFRYFSRLLYYGSYSTVFARHETAFASFKKSIEKGAVRSASSFILTLYLKLKNSATLP